MRTSYDVYTSGALEREAIGGLEAPDFEGLARDVIYGSSDWQKASEAFQAGRESGFTAEELSQLASGASMGAIAVGGWTPPGLFAKGGVAAAGVIGAGRLGRIAKRGDWMEDLAQVQRARRAGLDDSLAPLRASLPEEPGVVGTQRFQGRLSAEDVQRTAEELATRAVESPPGLAALPVEEIADVLVRTDSFRGLLEAERAAMVTQTRTALSEFAERVTSGRTPLLTETSRFGTRAGAAVPTGVPQGPTEAIEKGLFRPILEGDDYEAALNVAQQLKNASIFLTRAIDDPQYYREFNRILQSVSQSSGVPLMPINVALSTASAQASPFFEGYRLAKVVRFMRLSKTKTGTRVVYDRQRAERAFAAGKEWGIKPSDNFIHNTGEAFAEALNDPDFLKRSIVGQSSKTNPYTIARHDPEWAIAYVADTVDGLGRYLLAPAATQKVTTQSGQIVNKKLWNDQISTSNPTYARWNQFVGRVLGNVYGVPASWIQEALWPYIRVGREGMLPIRAGRASARPLPSAFESPDGQSLEALLTRSMRELNRDVRDFAVEQYGTFANGVRAGTNELWTWDAVRNMPVPADPSALIPASARTTKRGKLWTPSPHAQMQPKMLEAAQELGPELRTKIATLHAITGIPIAVLLAAIGLDMSPGPEFQRELLDITESDVKSLEEFLGATEAV